MPDTLAALRRRITALEGGDAPPRESLFTLGLEDADEHLGGGLARGAVHEIYAGAFGDLTAAGGFALALAIRAIGEGRSDADRPLVWVRHRMAGTECGGIDPHGLVHFGLDPDRLILVDARDVAEGLRVGREALGCASLGAVIMELWGSSPALDLVATRRLMRAAAQAGGTGLLLRGHGVATPSAAQSRWQVRAASSVALAANAPGHPCFDIELERHRAGLRPDRWRMEWDRDAQNFRNAAEGTAQVPRPLPAISADQPAAPDRRRAG